MFKQINKNPFKTLLFFLFFMIFYSMFAATQNLQIFWSIICSDVVNMMDALTSFQFSTQNLFHNISMLKLIFILINSFQNISLAMFRISSLPVMMFGFLFVIKIKMSMHRWQSKFNRATSRTEIATSSFKLIRSNFKIFVTKKTLSSQTFVTIFRGIPHLLREITSFTNSSFQSSLPSHLLMITNKTIYVN